MITSLHVLDKKKIIVKNYTSYSFTLIFFKRNCKLPFSFNIFVPKVNNELMNATVKTNVMEVFPQR